MKLILAPVSAAALAVCSPAAETRPVKVFIPARQSDLELQGFIARMG